MIEPDLSNFNDIRPVPGHAGIFATADGDIVSVRRGGRPRILKAYPFRRHLRINIVKYDGTRDHEPLAVAVLVALAFDGPRPSDQHGAFHRDGNEKNNAATNVYWAAAKERVRVQVRRGTHPRGVRHGMAKLNDDAVRQIRRRAAFGATDTDLAGVYGVTSGCISAVVSRKTWRHVTAQTQETAATASKHQVSLQGVGGGA